MAVLNSMGTKYEEFVEFVRDATARIGAVAAAQMSIGTALEIGLLRRRPTSGGHEPAYPLHGTVVFSIRYPNMTCHEPTRRCKTEEPHQIANCGEFNG